MATAKGLRSLSRLRGRVGVGVLPRFTLFVWRELPHPASHHSMRCDLPRKRERCSECADRPIQPKIIPALGKREARSVTAPPNTDHPSQAHAHRPGGA